MKSFIILIIIVSTLWSMYAFPDYVIFPQLNTNPLPSLWNMLIGVYKYGFPSVTWVVAVVYIYDFFMAIINKSSPYMKELYQSVKVELLTLTALMLFTVVIYTTTLSKLSNLTIDISMAGFGFMFFGNVGFLKLFSFKVGKVKYPWKMAATLSFLSLASSIYFLNVTLEIARGEFDLVQSLWYQITILSYSLSLYFMSKHIIFIMDKGRLEASPTLRKLFLSMPTKNKVYEDAAIAAEKWNKEMQKERAKASALMRKGRGKKRKKKRGD